MIEESEKVVGYTVVCPVCGVQTDFELYMECYDAPCYCGIGLRKEGHEVDAVPQPMFEVADDV